MDAANGVVDGGGAERVEMPFELRMFVMEQQRNVNDPAWREQFPECCEKLARLGVVQTKFEVEAAWKVTTMG
jgi:hypothetical protein